MNKLKNSLITIRLNQFLLAYLCCISCEQETKKKLILPSLFSDGMVLQRDTLVHVWGQGKPGELVTLNGSWNFSKTTRVNDSGAWKVVISTSKDPGPHTLLISSSKDTKKISNLLFGEVWLVAGQSNMEMDFDYCCNTTDSASKVIKETNYPLVRMFNVKKNLEYEPTNKVDGYWMEAVGEGVTSFSAAGFFFAKSIYEELDTPVGIIHSSWGGSRLEAWTSREVLEQVDEYEEFYVDFMNNVKENIKAREWFSKYTSIVSPSHGWDLFLSEYIKKKNDDIDYLSYFISDWRQLDQLGVEKINNPTDQIWKSIDKDESVDDLFGTKGFSGVTFFKNHFQVDNVDEILSLSIQPEKDLPWGLWEYDIYINSDKVFSSLISIEKDEYSFNKISRTIEIDSSYLRSGDNQIAVRIIGNPSTGDISIINGNGEQTNLEDGWQCALIAEEWYQISDYTYPYVSLYHYDGYQDLFSQPKKTIIDHNSPSILYNGMINPLIPFTIKGLVWYQGESNVESGDPKFKTYDTLMALFINDLRKKWETNLPFYFAQIAPYFNYGGMSPYFREAQAGLLRIPNTGMVVTMDIGEIYDIHPSNKHDVGDRFARLALMNQYNKDIVSSGPVFKKARKQNNRVFLEFDHLDEGLVLDNTLKSEFELAGEDKIYHYAKVENHGSYLELYSLNVDHPLFLRYAFSDTSSATLFNSAGLPASSFSYKIKN